MAVTRGLQPLNGITNHQLITTHSKLCFVLLLQVALLFKVDPFSRSAFYSCIHPSVWWSSIHRDHRSGIWMRWASSQLEMGALASQCIITPTNLAGVTLYTPSFAPIHLMTDWLFDWLTKYIGSKQIQFWAIDWVIDLFGPRIDKVLKTPKACSSNKYLGRSTGSSQEYSKPLCTLENGVIKWARD